MSAVLAAFGVAAAIAGVLTIYARRGRRELVVIGRDVTVPRAVGIPTAHRRRRKDIWP